VTLVIAMPRTGNIARAVAQARAGKLRHVELGALTTDMLQTLSFSGPVVVSGHKAAIDMLRARHDVIFATEQECAS